MKKVNKILENLNTDIDIEAVSRTTGLSIKQINKL